MFQIINDFEGANCKILSVEGNTVRMDVELRDTQGDWFFWCFKVVGAAGKTLTFTFPSDARVGYYGAAVSHDYKTWEWQLSERSYKGNAFTYTFKEGENEVYFAHDMLYRPERFFDFAKKRNIEVKTLCISERGREVPYIEFGAGEELILLTARHHACESTGNYVLEGVLEALIKSPLHENFRVVCVPFVDYDGVVDGDQGKNRNGKDHNRDYEQNDAPRYASIAAIRKIVAENKLRFAFDFHSPWHWSGSNDTLFIPIKHYGDHLKRIIRFSNIFEEETLASAALPHYAADDMHPDVDWNSFGSPCFGTYMGIAGAELSFTLETPYFIATDTPFTAERGVETGRCFVCALEKYVKRSRRVGIVGDLLYETPMNEICAAGDGYDYRQLLLPAFSDILDCDFLTGNPETPYSGKELLYTHERWCFNTPEEGLFTLKKNGFDMLTFANNHCTDRGLEGLKMTCKHCREAGMDFIGISDGERNAVYIKDFGDRKVAFVNATYGTNAFANRQFLPEELTLKAVALTQPQETLAGSIHLLEPLEKIEELVQEGYDPDRAEVLPYLGAIRADIEYAKKNADYVVMLLHCGGQYNEVPDAYTRKVVERIKSFGADMVVANHPHIILPSTLEGDYFTAYSIGNLQSAVEKSEEMGRINPSYSAVLYLDFEEGVKEPSLSFSIMKICYGEKTPKTSNVYEIYRKTKDEKIKEEGIAFANRFFPDGKYTTLQRKYKIR